MIPVPDLPSRLLALAVAACLCLGGCMLDPGGTGGPAPAAESSELRQGGENRSGKAAATPGSLCAREWVHSLADTVWICPDPKPPGAP